MSISYLQSFLSRFPINQSLNMNQHFQHCFLLDGKTILPIDRNDQLFISTKKLNKIENKYCSCYQRKYQSHLSNEKLKSNINNNKHDQINQEDLCSCSLQSIEKLSEDKHRKFSIAKQSTCKHHYSDQQKTYLTNPIIPSINFIIDSNQINNNQSNKSSSAITIIIKPFISSEDYQNLKKRKNSSSLESTTKRISTFKDITRTILPISTSINLNEKRSSNILKSRTLFDIYCNKKQHLIEK